MAKKKARQSKKGRLPPAPVIKMRGGMLRKKAQRGKLTRKARIRLI